MKRKLRKALALGIACVMAVGVLTSCGGSGSSGGDAGAEKVLRFGCAMYTDGLIDTAYDQNCGWNFMRYGIGESLYKFDDNMEPQPFIAESLPVTEDYKTFTITLKEGVKFSDGCDVTATKVVESYQRLMTEGPNGSATPENYLPYDAKLTADDDARTITIELSEPEYNLAGNLAFPTMALVDVADTTDFKNGSIGTGPYKVDSFQDQVGYTVSKNEYYREDVPFDKIEIMFMGDNTAKAMALEGGQVDLVENITQVSDIQKFQDSPDFEVSIAAGVRSGFSWINHNGVLGNDTLRKAVQMCIDDETICNSNLIGGLYTAGYAVLPSSLGYEGLKDTYAFDLDGANKLLDDAGIVDNDGDGIRELDGQNINLKFVSYENRLLNEFSDAHTDALKKIGIAVTPAYGSSDDQWSSLVAGEYDLNNNNWTTVGTGDPSTFMANWYSKAESNYCGYKNEEYDKLYEQMLEIPNLKDRAELVTKMQQILIDDGALLLDGYYNSSMIYSKATVGNAAIHTADYYWITTEITPAE